MGALMDAYEAAKSKKAQIPEVAALPAAYAPAYYEAMGKPYTSPEPAGIQDIPGAVSKAYKGAGGGFKGVAFGALAGLGKAGEFISTKTGNQILAGTASSPYLAQGYLNNAEQARSDERSEKSAAASSNLERMKQMGEDVREAGKSAAAAKQSESNLILQNSLNAPQLAISQGQLDLAGKREAREGKVQEQSTEYTQKVKPILDSATDLYKKGNLKDADYAKITQNPLKYKISSSAHKLMGIGTNAGLTEGTLHVDAQGNKAYVFPDGTINEVK